MDELITGYWKNCGNRPLYDEWIFKHGGEIRQSKDPRATTQWRVIGLDASGSTFTRVRLQRVGQDGVFRHYSLRYVTDKMRVVNVERQD